MWISNFHPIIGRESEATIPRTPYNYIVIFIVSKTMGDPVGYTLLILRGVTYYPAKAKITQEQRKKLLYKADWSSTFSYNSSSNDFDDYKYVILWNVSPRSRMLTMQDKPHTVIAKCNRLRDTANSWGIGIYCQTRLREAQGFRLEGRKAAEWN